jgi:hypothetical protein
MGGKMEEERCERNAEVHTNWRLTIERKSSTRLKVAYIFYG